EPVAVLVGIGVVADAVAVGVAPLLGVERKRVPRHLAAFGHAVAVEVELFAVGNHVVVLVVADAVALVVGVDVVADHVAVAILGLLRIERKRVERVGHAVVVVVGVDVVRQAVVIAVGRRPGREEQRQVDDEVGRGQGLPAGGRMVGADDRGRLRRVPVSVHR